MLVPKVVANGELRDVTDSPRIRHLCSLLTILVRFLLVLFDNFGQFLDHYRAREPKKEASLFDHLLFIFQCFRSFYHTHLYAVYFSMV